MDEKKLIQDAISLLEDQMLDVHPLLKQEMRYEADGTPYVVLIQDQGIGGVKKFTYPVAELEALAATVEAERRAKEAQAKAAEKAKAAADKVANKAKAKEAEPKATTEGSKAGEEEAE